MKRIRLVSFLGLGPNSPNAKPPYYTPTRYALDGAESAATPLVDAALCELLTPVQSVVLLVTPQVKERWIATSLLKTYLPHEHQQFVDVPDGASEIDRWRIFETVRNALTHNPIPGIEQESPTEIVFNVTNGYRSHPILAMAAINFVLSEWARQELATPPQLRILYGAFDAKLHEGQPAPIWDLTEFVTASRWNGSIDALMRYGRADDLAQIANIDGRTRTAAAVKEGKSRRELASIGFVREFGIAAKRFADDLALARIQSLLTDSAPRFARTLAQQEVAPLIARLPVLREAIGQLRDDWLAPLCAANVLGAEGLLASAELAKYYGRIQRFAEQAATIREGLVTHYGLEAGFDTPVEPGQRGCNEQRDVIEKKWGAIVASLRQSSGANEPAPIIDNAKLASSVVNARNDIEHCGIRDQPLSAAKLREQLQQQTSAFASLVASVKKTQ